MRQNKANQDVRNAITEKGFYMWEIAEKLGISDTFFTKLMRVELPESEKRKIFDVIEGAADGTGEKRGS